MRARIHSFWEKNRPHLPQNPLQYNKLLGYSIFGVTQNQLRYGVQTAFITSTAFLAAFEFAMSAYSSSKSVSLAGKIAALLLGAIPGIYLGYQVGTIEDKMALGLVRRPKSPF